MIQKDINLQPHNSFQISETCEFFCSVTTFEELLEAIRFQKKEGLEVLFLGGGSNILISKKISGLVVRILNKGIQVLDETDNSVLVECAAGENWHYFVQQCLKNNWFGLENLSLIPGSVGASPMQNIGAYGVEVKSLIDRVQFLNLETNQLEELPGEKCEFGYRESIFKNALKNKIVIWKVVFKLSKIPVSKTEYGDIQAVLTRKKITDPSPVDVSDAVIEIRKSKLPDPAEIGNAGSFFKNPIITKKLYTEILATEPGLSSYPAGEDTCKVPAGWLIEKCGWKGKTLGNYGVHKNQALVLVNYGGANGSQIYDLACQIQSDVKARFGISLQIEVNLV